MFRSFRFRLSCLRPYLAGLVLIVAVLDTPSDAAANEWLVLSTSVGAPVVEGEMLAGGTRLEIEAGIVVTALSPDGGIVRMVGPCDCTLPEARGGPSSDDASAGPRSGTRGVLLGDSLWAAALPALKQIAARADAPVAGAPSRPGTELTSRPGLWEMSVETSGDRCGRQGAAARLVIHVLPRTIDQSEWGEVLIWMAARNCREQAQALVDGLNDGSLFPGRERRPGLSEL